MNDAVVPITSEPGYKEAIARWEAFWSLEDVGRPMWMIPTPPVLTAAEVGLVPIRPLLQDRESSSTPSWACSSGASPRRWETTSCPTSRPSRG